jgi:tetratricopeptide (TPR) repeat protein
MRVHVQHALGAVLIGALVFSTAAVQPFKSRPYLHTNLYLPSGKFVEQASLGYRELAADMVWFQAVQYYGGYRISEHDLAYFSGLIDIVTELDPHFVFPYTFGAIVLAQDLGEFDRGIALLRRGMDRNPQVWDFPFEIGFLNYTMKHADDVAGRYFELASRMPGDDDRARRFAAFVYAKGGHVETSMRMWEELERDAEEPYMRDLARHYLERLRRGEGVVGKHPGESAPADSSRAGKERKPDDI